MVYTEAGIADGDTELQLSESDLVRVESVPEVYWRCKANSESRASQHEPETKQGNGNNSSFYSLSADLVLGTVLSLL